MTCSGQRGISWHFEWRIDMSELGMAYPVPSGILRKGMTIDLSSVDAVELEQETEASLCDDRMGGLERDVVAGDGSSCHGEAVRRQELPERQVRKLNNPSPGDLHDGDQA